MTHRRRISIAFALAATILVAGAWPATAQPVDVTASWTAPSTGSPVQHYVAQISTNGGPFLPAGTSETTSIDLALEVGATYTVRVAGVDDQGRQGPYSVASDPYTPDLGPPGQPGKPIVL